MAISSNQLVFSFARILRTTMPYLSKQRYFSQSRVIYQDTDYGDGESNYRLAKIDRKKYLQIDEPFKLYYGSILPNFQIAYETWGEMNESKDNVILLPTGLTPTSHARSHEGVTESTPGWWENFIGPNCKIDTNKYMVVCPNTFGSCYGTTGPGSLNPDTNKPYGSTFPAISVKDMVDFNAILLDSLGVKKLHSVVGSSLGGVGAILFASLFPERVNKVVSISGCLRAIPLSIAYRYLQRSCIMDDPVWNDGDFYDGQWPTDGLRFARKIATITYRGGNEWNKRFGRKRIEGAPKNHPVLYGEEFSIEQYIEYQGKIQGKNIKFDPNTLIHISKALDVFDIADHFESTEDALARIKCPTLIMGSSSDVLYPPSQQKEIYDIIKQQGNDDVELHIIESDYGHDAFLLEEKQMGDPMKAFLER